MKEISGGVKGFMLFADQREFVSLLSAEQKAVLLDGLFAFCCGEEPQIKDTATLMAFTIMRRSIERVWEFSEKQRENGMKRSSKSSQTKPDEANASLKCECESKYESESVNPPISPSGEISPRQPARKKAAFIPPTLEEVQAYCDERMNSIDAQHFHDYYAVRGWKLKDGQKMQDWKACVRTWERSEGSRQQGRVTQMPHPISEAERRQMHNDEVCRQVLAERQAGKEGPWV